MNWIKKYLLGIYSTYKSYSGYSFVSYKMVRYFPNTYKDYKHGKDCTFNQEEYIQHIDNYINSIIKRMQPNKRNIDGGLYVGITGVAYMFYYLTKNSFLSGNKKQYLEKGLLYLNPALQSSAGDKTSFVLGDAGTYALAAVLFKEIGDEQYELYLNNYKSLYSSYLKPKFLQCGGDEFFVGRAGYIAGALWLNRELQTQILTNEELYKICDVMVASGREYSVKNNSPCPLMYHYYNTEYLGAAHGISFILQMLLTVPGYLEQNEGAAKEIKSTIDFILSLQNQEGNWPCCLEEIKQKDHKLVHWCHGAPGIVYLFGKAYLVFQEEKYLNACIKAGELVWNKGLLYKGPGICHGVAGNGYVFLLLYRLTGSEKYIYQAKIFADFMQSDRFLKDARVPDNPESLYEGTAGTVCFLADVLVPDAAQFPFQDIF